jgi:hypothetical protein
MVGIVVVTRTALLIARPASTSTVAEHLNGQSPVCVAVSGSARPNSTASRRPPRRPAAALTVLVLHHDTPSRGPDSESGASAIALTLG